jgi:hypothetical protein
MGKELLCRVHHDGKTGSGNALLETNEILFRGEFRLKIPLASLKSVVARDGELRLKWPGSSAVFELDGQAEKWAHKILHPKSTAEKLGIKPGLVISAIGVDDTKFIEDLRAGAALFSDSRPLKNSDLIFYQAARTSDLDRVKKLAPSLASPGSLWIVYPKGKQEIKEAQVLAAGKEAGLVDIKVVSFSVTHTALKFVRPKSAR